MRSGGEIALACFDEELITESVSMMWKSTLVCIVSIISAIFLIATLAVYVILPELRELQDKAMMAAVTTLAVSYTVLSIQHVQPIEIEDDYTICISFGIYIYIYCHLYTSSRGYIIIKFSLASFFNLSLISNCIFIYICFRIHIVLCLHVRVLLAEHRGLQRVAYCVVSDR